jgi:hypothetical protein
MVLVASAGPAAAAEKGSGVILFGSAPADIDVPPLIPPSLVPGQVPVCGHVVDSALTLTATQNPAPKPLGEGPTWTAGGGTTKYFNDATIYVEADNYYANPVGTYKASSGGCNVAPEAVPATGTVRSTPSAKVSCGPLTGTWERVNTDTTISLTGNCTVTQTAVGTATSSVTIDIHGQSQPCALPFGGPPGTTQQGCIVTDFTGGTYTET